MYTHYLFFKCFAGFEKLKKYRLLTQIAPNRAKPPQTEPNQETFKLSVQTEPNYKLLVRSSLVFPKLSVRFGLKNGPNRPKLNRIHPYNQGLFLELLLLWEDWSCS